MLVKRALVLVLVCALTVRAQDTPVVGDGLSDFLDFKFSGTYESATPNEVPPS